MFHPVQEIENIENTLRTLFPGDPVIELRILNTDSGVVSGYFDDYSELAKDAVQWDEKAGGIYMTLNPVKPELLARAMNRVIPYAKHTTQDSDIQQRAPEESCPKDAEPVLSNILVS
jgi:hypothetical protein